MRNSFTPDEQLPTFFTVEEEREGDTDKMSPVEDPIQISSESREVGGVWRWGGIAMIALNWREDFGRFKGAQILDIGETSPFSRRRGGFFKGEGPREGEEEEEGDGFVVIGGFLGEAARKGVWCDGLTALGVVVGEELRGIEGDKGG